MGAPGPAAPLADRRERQRAFWRKAYAEDPAFFGEGPSDFARWCLPILREAGSVHDLIELGCGYRRDARFFAREGYRVVGVDLVGVDPPAPDASSTAEIVVEADALEFLDRCREGSVDAVYSNMFFNMDFTEGEHRALFRAVRRTLRPGGLHLYSVRSTSDPWYGRGRCIGPDTFDPAPLGVPMHYFSERYADRLAAEGFAPVRRLERREGEPDFPITLLFVVDRRR